MSLKTFDKRQCGLRGLEEEFIQNSSDQLKISRPWGRLQTLKEILRWSGINSRSKSSWREFFVRKKIYKLPWKLYIECILVVKAFHWPSSLPRWEWKFSFLLGPAGTGVREGGESTCHLAPLCAVVFCLGAVQKDGSLTSSGPC